MLSYWKSDTGIKLLQTTVDRMIRHSGKMILTLFFWNVALGEILMKGTSSDSKTFMMWWLAFVSILNIKYPW